MARRSSRGSRRSPTRSPETTKDLDLSEEYRYVIEDLERIGIIAAILIGGLVVLSFII